MWSTEISFGQAASHSPKLVQAPAPNMPVPGQPYTGAPPPALPGSIAAPPPQTAPHPVVSVPGQELQSSEEVRPSVDDTDNPAI